MQCKNLQKILLELQEGAKSVDEMQVEQFADAILAADRIFTAGAGRSGCAVRAFSNRLLHLGFHIYCVGDLTTPPIHKGDLLIIGSGSGTTSGLVGMAQKAAAQGADIATVTISPENAIGQMAKACIRLPGTTRLVKDGADSAYKSAQPVGSLFEQLSWLVYDSVVMTLKMKKRQTNEDLISRHANLE